jgi:hypothetical protein
MLLIITSASVFAIAPQSAVQKFVVTLANPGQAFHLYR